VFKKKRKKTWLFQSKRCAPIHCLIPFYVMECSCSAFREDPTYKRGNKIRIWDILTVDFNFWNCVIVQLDSANSISVTSLLTRTKLPFALIVLKSIYGNGFRYLYITLAASFLPYLHILAIAFLFIYTNLCSSLQVHIGASSNVYLPCL
jgi:hypothetical protein